MGTRCVSGVWSSPISPYRVRTRRVEIAQRLVTQAVYIGEVLQHVLDHQLGPAVHVERRFGSSLRYRNFIRLAVHRRRGRENKLVHARVHRGLNQIQAADHIVLVVFVRHLHGLAHKAARREVHHRVHAVLGKAAGKPGLVQQVRLHQNGIPHGLPVAFGQIVQHHRLMAAALKLPDHVAADIAGAA